MANLYNTATTAATPNNYSVSSSPPHEPDEISLFLQQILLRSSSSSATMRQQSFAAPSDHILAAKSEPEVVPGPAQIHVSSGLNPSSGCSFGMGNVSSSNVGNSENELDECDYESEEAVEAQVEGTAAKPTPSRSSSKRSRAAEVHNLSEKRRRSRINEKMKALQNLIPNSNKTDKASMLDEAIEYLKQLQLQVQMLTMRNGLSLYPICLPGVLQPNQTSQMRMDAYDSDKLANMNMTKPICMDQNISAPVTDFSRMIGSKTALDTQSSMQQLNFGALHLPRSSKGICEEKIHPCRSLIEDLPQSCSGAKTTSSIQFETQTTNLKGNMVEACQIGADHLLANFVNNPIFSSQSNIYTDNVEPVSD